MPDRNMTRINLTPDLRTMTILVLITVFVPASANPVDDEFLHEMILYVEQVEQRILADGRPLSDSEKALARRAGVEAVDRVRVLVLDSIPLPDSEVLRQHLEERGLLRLLRSGRGTAKGYGIILTPPALTRPTDLAHELVHVGQYEQLGGISGLLEYHLPDLQANGYRRSGLEDEAYRLAPAIVDPDR